MDFWNQNLLGLGLCTCFCGRRWTCFCFWLVFSMVDAFALDDVKFIEIGTMFKVRETRQLYQNYRNLFNWYPLQSMIPDNSTFIVKEVTPNETSGLLFKFCYEIFKVQWSALFWSHVWQDLIFLMNSPNEKKKVSANPKAKPANAESNVEPGNPSAEVFNQIVTGPANVRPISSPRTLPDQFALSLSGCGFLGCYHFGVLNCFHKNAKVCRFHISFSHVHVSDIDVKSNENCWSINGINDCRFDRFSTR